MITFSWNSGKEKSKFLVKKYISGALENMGGLTRMGHKNFRGDKNVCGEYMDMWVYQFVKTHQNMHFKWLFKFYLNTYKS